MKNARVTGADVRQRWTLFYLCTLRALGAVATDAEQSTRTGRTRVRGRRSPFEQRPDR
jgi:hypothetical protein